MISTLRSKAGIIRTDGQQTWQDWGTPRDGVSVPRYKTYFSHEDTGTGSLTQGTLIYPPGTRVVPHWHTPVETYFVLQGGGLAYIAGETFLMTQGTGVYIPSRAIHWFENNTDRPLVVFWTLACDGLSDLDFTPVEPAPGALPPSSDQTG